MTTRRTTTAIGAAVAMLWATSAAANHNHPNKAPNFTLWFVRAANQCASTPLTHNAPLAFPACTPSTPGTTISFGPAGNGKMQGVVRLNTNRQGTDVRMMLTFVDVRNGDDGTGPPFNGVLTANTMVRQTNHYCTTPGACTMIDLPLPVQLPCGTAASPALAAGRCRTTTSANAVIPGAITPGKETSIESVLPTQIFNGIERVFSAGLYVP